MTRSYRRLDVDLIQCTNQKLCARIQERFPTANTNDLSRKIWQKITVLHEYQQECANTVIRLPPTHQD